MTKAKLLVLGLGLALVALFATPASAQDGPTITADPASVEAAGETEFTITGSGWTVASLFVLPCFDAKTLEDLAAGDPTTLCDTAALTVATPADGAFELTVTYAVPEDGMCIAAGDAGQVESSAVCITVGAPAEEEPTEEAAEETTETEGEEALPATGTETTVLLIMGGAVLAAGAMVFGFSRKFTRA